MSINDIPKTKTTGFPTGVSEHTYATQAEMTAFLDGVHLADDIDVEAGDPFQREGKWVVRVRVGEWDNEA